MKKIENFQKFCDFRTKQFFKNQKLLLVSDTLSLDAPITILVTMELRSSKEFYGAHYQ